MAAEHPPDRDEDLELALRLHRELNAVPRRQRQPVRTQAATAALKTLSKKLHRQEDQESSSSESEADDRSHGGDQKRRRGGAAAAAPSDNDSGSKRRRQHKEGAAGSGKKAAAVRTRPGRRPQHVAAADEARAKAAQAAATAASGDVPRTHVKCFYAGLQHGAWLAVESLSSRASLAAAVSRIFQEDGVCCSGDTATVVFVTGDKQSLEFPGQAAQRQHSGGMGGGEQNGGGGGGSENMWEAAARRAVRVYVR